MYDGHVVMPPDRQCIHRVHRTNAATLGTDTTTMHASKQQHPAVPVVHHLAVMMVLLMTTWWFGRHAIHQTRQPLIGCASTVTHSMHNKLSQHSNAFAANRQGCHYTTHHSPNGGAAHIKLLGPPGV